MLSRVTSDTTLLRAVFTDGIVESVGAVFMLVGAIVMMALMDGFLLLVTLVILVLVGGLVGLVMPRIQRASVEAQASVGEMGAVLDRVLQAFRTVKASGAEDREIAAVGEAAARPGTGASRSPGGPRWRASPRGSPRSWPSWRCSASAGRGSPPARWRCRR
ncbi:ABC transporter transmembrane domain-containing protein [Planomonospora algeriensis]